MWPCTGYNSPCIIHILKLTSEKGQGSGQKDLSVYCDEATVDIIPIGFVNAFPAQANGLVGDDYGNQCGSAVYAGPGYMGAAPVAADNLLHASCPALSIDIAYCQASTNKKILLSLGGAIGTYALDTQEDGIYLANYLWKSYGPYDPLWAAMPNHYRPFGEIAVDGFDFDIEMLPANGGE